MKKILAITSSLLLCTVCFSQSGSAQLGDSNVQGKVQMAVYIPEQSESIPTGAQRTLTTRINTMLTNSGMGSTDNFTQFFVTCDALVTEKNVIPGAPTKYQQKIELNLYVVDAFGGKRFGVVQIPSHAVANSEQKAYISCFNTLPTSSKEVIAFFKKASANIIAYYDSKVENIIAKARTLARGKKYEEALFELSLVPDVCASYPKVLEVALEIYDEYVDMQAYENLAKARAIWNAGQDSAAAAEAGEYLAQINPNSKWYVDAVKLSDEMKTRVKSDIDYYRKQDEIDRAREHEATMANIAAWKAVGVAFGNNQKSNTYYNAYAVR